MVSLLLFPPVIVIALDRKCCVLSAYNVNRYAGMAFRNRL